MNLFRNIQLYRLQQGFKIDPESLQSILDKKQFQECGSQDMASRGWVSPTADDRLILSVSGRHLLFLKTQEKLLPLSVVNDFAQDKADEIEAQQGFKPGRQQMKDIKEAVRQELIPKSFSRYRITPVCIAPEEGWLWIDSATSSKADDVLDALRDTLETFPLSLVKTDVSPVSAMTQWLVSGEPPELFTVDAECELRSPTEENATVRYIRHALDGGDVQAHIAAGKLPTRLAMTFDDRVSFLLTDCISLRRIDFLDTMKEQVEQAADAAALQIEADFTIISAEVMRLLGALMGLLEEERQAA